MRYLGGKHRQGKKIAEYVGRVLKPHQVYIEPFCGALGSAHQVAKIHNGRMVLSDQHYPLIKMWQEVLFNGWIPPQEITEIEYNQIKKIQDPENPLTAFSGYGCAFAGKYFGTYARNGDTRKRGFVSRESSNLIMKRAQSFSLNLLDLKIQHCDYKIYSDTHNAVFYLDPPYKDRTKQSNFKFNHDEFWQYAREMALSNIVLVTEFIVPDDFVILHNFGDTVVRHYSGKPADGTCEVLVCHKSQAHLWGVET